MYIGRRAVGPGAAGLSRLRARRGSRNVYATIIIACGASERLTLRSFRVNDRERIAYLFASVVNKRSRIWAARARDLTHHRACKEPFASEEAEGNIRAT